MDNQIKLRVQHSKTGQVCEFDTHDQLDNFGDSVANRELWQLIGTDLAKAGADSTATVEVTGGKVIQVELSELRDAVAADTAAADAAAPSA